MVSQGGVNVETLWVLTSFARRLSPACMTLIVSDMGLSSDYIDLLTEL
jgi:hypothetical protein